MNNVDFGDPWGNRTPVSGVRGLRLNRLTNGPFPHGTITYTLKTEQREGATSLHYSLGQALGLLVSIS